MNQWGADDAIFLHITTSGGSARVRDLGCGTGRMTIAIAQADVAVTGIDSHQPSVAAAQQKLNADRVEWVICDSRAIPANREFGVAIMSSNVTQAILEDADLSRTFRDIATHMRTDVNAGRRIAATRRSGFLRVRANTGTRRPVSTGAAD